MNILLQFIFIFYIGCTIGWILELFFRRIVHGKWVNPGFLIGPYLPIYGFGLVTLTVIFLLFKDSDLNPIIIVLLMGLFMTLIELIGGLMGLKNNIRLWDYSNQWGNYKGVICPLFSAIWTAIGGVYYFILAPYVMHALDWFGENLAFSYTLGLFTGFIIIDYFYSSKLYSKIKQYAKENNFTVKYEQLKVHIKDEQNKRKEKYSFMNPFKQTKSLKEYLVDYKNKKKEKFDVSKLKTNKKI
ncbi:MAG: putative ABC transporter permease [Clostridia bacterium]|nr:putative ABC transporter permease [Clostridia bacterium]